MKRCRQLIKQNSGFSLIELLVAIAILAMLTVPLLNSFVMSGRITKNSTAYQDATTIAQSVMESAKRVSNENLTEFYENLANIDGVTSRTMLSAEGDAVWKCSLLASGSGSEPYKLDVTLTPKSDYVYKDTDFTDIYSEANVIYSELTLYDNSVLTAIKNMDIPYGSTIVEKWVDDGAGSGSWVTIAPSAVSDSIKNTWRTYDNLLADECDGAIVGLSVPEGGFTNLNAFLTKANMEKHQSITFSVEALGVSPNYKALMDTRYIFPIQKTGSEKYSVVCSGVDDADPTQLTYYRFSGTIIYDAPSFEWSLSDVKPIYLLYAKGYIKEGAYKTFFGKTQSDIIFDSSVYLGTDEAGVQIPAEIYLVEQDAPAVPVDREFFEYTLANNAAVALNFYTNEIYDSENASNNSIQLKTGNIHHSNTVNNTLSYKKKDDITPLYNVVIEVYYDKKHDGSYAELIYSVKTEDN